MFLTGSNQEEISLDEVLVPNAIYEKAETLTTVQKRLYLGNVEEFVETNMQQYVNLISLVWVREDLININAAASELKAKINTSGTLSAKGTYQDPAHTFFNKSFKSGECYAFYMVFNYKNGKRSKAFHIPGRAGTVADRTVLNPGADNEFDNIDGTNDVYRYQIHDTHGYDPGPAPIRKGAMGFWENENEEYPLDPNNPANIHPDFANIPGISVGSRKVRHHVFPDLASFYSLGAKTTDRFVEINTPLIQSKVFGIEIRTFDIPIAIQPFIESWEVYYAKRTNANIRII
ncbi:MAG TPA: hypothetical protein PKI46_10190, partial [Bacteroidales bacterium]|nr:hypothetical protein [Bacteroidales bacterium]